MGVVGKHKACQNMGPTCLLLRCEGTHGERGHGKTPLGAKNLFWDDHVIQRACAAHAFPGWGCRMMLLAAGGPLSTRSLPPRALACRCVGFIQPIEQAGWRFHPYHPSLADGLTWCPEPALWYEEGEKHERALLAVQWKYWLIFQAKKRGWCGGGECCHKDE